MELILLFTTIFYAKKYFNIYKYVYELFVFKTVLVLVIYFVYVYFFAEYNEIFPRFNDQFLYLTMSNNDYDIGVLLKSIFSLSLYSTNYGVFLSFFSNLVFDMQLFAIMLNNFFIFLLILYMLKILKVLNVKEKYSIYSVYMLMLSPYLLFMSTLVLRDTIIMALFTVLSYYAISKKYYKSVFVALGLWLLKKHLLAIFIYSYLIKFKYINKFTTAKLLILAFFGFLLIPHNGIIDVDLIDYPKYIVAFPKMALSLNFLFDDTLSISYKIGRLLFLDTYLPQCILIFILLYYRKTIKIHDITYIYFLLIFIYFFLYFKYNSLSFRSTNMPFIALVYIQIVYYVNQIIEYKRNSHKEAK